jgi:hypothetical protein
MKKLLKVIIPPFIGFSLYFVGVRYSPDYFDLTIGQIGTGTLAGFMAFYKYTLPLLFFIAILTQLLIVMPAWNNLVHRSARAKVWAAISLVIICLVFAGGISYLIWDRATGTGHLVKTFLFMAMIQLVYWSINLFVLSIIE